jgi:predicted transcriptional regulator
MESAWKAFQIQVERKILLLLMERDMTPTEISRYFQFTMPVVSVHLLMLLFFRYLVEVIHTINYIN